jgi:hypothetical protein
MKIFQHVRYEFPENNVMILVEFFHYIIINERLTCSVRLFIIMCVLSGYVWYVILTPY